MLRFDKPLVAEVTGHAMGGGDVMTSACDYRYMLSTGCRISFTEIGFGLPLPGMFVYKLQQSINLTNLNEICLEAAAYKNEKIEKAPFGTVSNPIEMMMQEHKDEGDRFVKIAELTNNFTPPADACNTYKVTFQTLKEFEQDLHRHIHLENNILFPKAVELEKKMDA